MDLKRKIVIGMGVMLACTIVLPLALVVLAAFGVFS